MGAEVELTPKPEMRRRAPRKRAPEPPSEADVAAVPTEILAPPPEVNSLEDCDPAAAADGEWLKMAEELFPIAWLTMVVAVSYIGIYFAVETLPGQNLLPGPGWFN